MEQGIGAEEMKHSYQWPSVGDDTVRQSEIPAEFDRLSQNIDRLGSTIAVLGERLDAGGVLSAFVPLAEARGPDRDGPGAPAAMRLRGFADSVESFRDTLDGILRRLEV